MNKGTYIPQPVDLTGVELPDDMKEIAEMMAQNVHEVWAKNRIEQGWTYGPQRDDIAKKHPCLVPYEELPEEEKLYDRETSIETLKLIIKSGYEIKKKL